MIIQNRVPSNGRNAKAKKTGVGQASSPSGFVEVVLRFAGAGHQYVHRPEAPEACATCLPIATVPEMTKAQSLVWLAGKSVAAAIPQSLDR